ncbi:TonB-dependent hemoglobin/transferrin/lactoferrin family receptor [Candidatus Bartonella washoeensis]|uniref:TonB-dependent hemoglobin/transferrin/lactoferrin receptor family protein n=1 Tax=Cardidatus Bartonella washoeensis 085-0475 TaxID=1094564 RepID=J0QRM1_9HYPH|nr:TonB-dependent hemoglobin/transferrin/lactoferrin family receptor [Bartonella washoeensis]EJF85714.1 TonB-dependent hemoglobin/transferrin/lactoferrin receptor family protein [Bartonella washoeensis 085-0475]
MQIRRKNIYKSCVILSALSVCIPSFVFAQNKERGAVTELNPIVIKGKKIEDASGSVTILTNRKTAKDINEKQISDVHDISRLDPSVTYNTGKNSFVIRGLDANRVLTTMDGIALPWFDDILRGNGGNTTFDFGALSTFDVIQGSDSSLYGSGALGGVVALRTLNPEDLITEEKNWGSLVKGGYHSVDKSWRVDQAIALRNHQTFFLFQGSHVEGHERKNMGTVDGYGERTRKNPAQFDRNNLLFKIHQYFNDNHRLGFTAERFDDDINTHSLDASKRYAPGSVYDKDKKLRERLSLSYNYNGNEDSVLDAFHGQMYWQRQSNRYIMTGFRVAAPNGDYLRDNFLRNTNYGFNADALKKVHIGTVDHKLKLATNVLSSKFHHYLLGKDNCHVKEYARGCLFVPANRSDSPDTNGYNLGFVFEDEIGFAGNRFRVTPGVRYDWYKYVPQKTPSYEKALISDKFPPERSGSRFSPKLRMEWDIRNQVTLYAQWAQAFRAPRISELYVSYIKPSAYYVKGEPNLKAETSNGYDVGLRYGNENFGGILSAFFNQYKDFIDTVDKGPSEEFRFSRRHYTNRANVRILGVETKMHWVLNNGFHANFALAYSQGRDLDKNEYLNSIPALKAVIGVGYAKEIWGADVVLTSSAKRDKVAKDSDYQKIPGYKIVDVSGWLKPFGEKGLIVRAGVYNLFNEKYWDISDLPSGKSTTPKDYFSQPGRNFKVSFVQRF